ncbi:lipoprotein [Clostridium sp. D2Q-11]|uniref:Lipoprotein n=1 Tax=Anaeromonas frigoriresistens TaxID=2683708 RepID=A0A942UVS8_9FIRM|nr:lipoprotein [Anaeromonas frigoriresistens]MBS4538965.1 lipoprotein [Anaeromonas frigoriresistens]
MKKSLLGLVVLLMLTGCQQSNNTNVENTSIDEITTYKETIKDGKVEIDRISYDIKSVTKIINTYDENENIIEKNTTNDDSEILIEYLYENNQLIEDRAYSKDELSFTNYYYYEDDLLMKKKTVHKGGLETRTEYSYGDKTETRTHYNSDGSISFITKAYLDEDGKMVEGIITNAEGEESESISYHYKNDLLIKGISKKEGMKIKTFNYKYNNIGDKIMDYIIFHGEVNTLLVNFYDIEYDENLLPKTVTIYRVQSQIADEDIRDFQ